MIPCELIVLSADDVCLTRISSAEQTPLALARIAAPSRCYGALLKTKGAISVLPVVAALVLVLACGSEGGQSHAPPRNVARTPIAAIDGEPVDADELLITGDRKRDRRTLDALIARKLAAREASARGLAADAATKAKIASLHREAAAREEEILRDSLFAAIRAALALNDEDLRKHYEKTRSRYTERRIRLCRQRFASKEEAEALDAELGADGRLDPDACEAIGPTAAAELPAELIPEALRLQRPGDRTTVVREGGASLVDLVEILPAAQRSFEEARSEVEESFRTLRAQQAFLAEIERLRRAAAIEIDEEALHSARPRADAEPESSRIP